MRGGIPIYCISVCSGFKEEGQYKSGELMCGSSSGGGMPPSCRDTHQPCRIHVSISTSSTPHARLLPDPRILRLSPAFRIYHPPFRFFFPLAFYLRPVDLPSDSNLTLLSESRTTPRYFVTLLGVKTVCSSRSYFGRNNYTKYARDKERIATVYRQHECIRSEATLGHRLQAPSEGELVPHRGQFDRTTTE